MKQTLLPAGWPRPKGYSNGFLFDGPMVMTAGVIGWNEDEVFASNDLPDQFRQALVNTKAILAEAGATPEDIVSMTWYVTHMPSYRNSLKQIGSAWRDVFGKVYPCLSCVEVVSLVEPLALIEMETRAVLPRSK